MISAKTTRKMILGGQSYTKGAPINLPKNQFDDLGPDGVGLVERAPAEKKAEPKPATKAD